MDDNNILREIIFNRFILSIIKEKNGKKIVYETDLDELKLSPEQKKLCIDIMKTNNIEFKMNLTTSKDRSPLVRDFNYGKNETEGNQFRDVPRFSKIEYEGETLIFEDYEQLKEFLESEFIPNHITYKRKFGDKSGKLYPFLQLNNIVKLKLSEDENKYVMNYLMEEGIQVRGINSSIDEEYENYDYFRTYKTLNDDEIKQLSRNEQMKLFKELRRTGDPSIREKLIVANLKLANYVAYKYNFGELKDDILQIAYEGLIKSVDKFDPDKGNSFSTYAFKSIRHYMARHYSELRNSFGGDQNPHWQLSFKRCRDIVERYSECSMLEDESLVEDIVDLMIQEGAISETSRQQNIDRIKMHFCNASLEENLDELSEMEDNNPSRQLEKIIYDGSLAEIMNEVLVTLTPKERQVLELRFGFKGNKPKTYREIGEIMELTEQRIKQLETRALQKMRNPSRVEKFHDFYEEESMFWKIFNQLRKSSYYIDKYYLKECGNIDKNGSFNVFSKEQQNILLEYMYYRDNKTKIFNYFEELRKSDDPNSKEQLEDILSILDPEEQKIVNLTCGLNGEKHLDIEKICLKTNKSLEEVQELLASFTKKLSYYYHHNIKSIENKKSFRK